MKQTLRIIGGKFRGKKWHFPLVEGLRPTPDRVRETLFNWLMHDIRGMRCLDAFAGSGALGLEAYSRGAQHIVFIETDPAAYSNLQQVLSQFSTGSALKAVKTDALRYLQESNETFDLIFIDPPFAKNYWPACLSAIASSSILSPNGLVYLESAHPLSLDTTLWETLKIKKAGNVIYALIRKN